jgi:hypothetical protein
VKEGLEGESRPEDRIKQVEFKGFSIINRKYEK